MTVLQQHFPVGQKREGILVEFPWYDAFQSNKRAASDSFAYEKASVLFNLAAVCSQQSLASDLATDGGLKAAARHFQVHDIGVGGCISIGSFPVLPAISDMHTTTCLMPKALPSKAYVTLCIKPCNEDGLNHVSCLWLCATDLAQLEYLLGIALVAMPAYCIGCEHFKSLNAVVGGHNVNMPYQSIMHAYSTRRWPKLYDA